jgi:hypothetical protein
MFSGSPAAGLKSLLSLQWLLVCGRCVRPMCACNMPGTCSTRSTMSCQVTFATSANVCAVHAAATAVPCSLVLAEPSFKRLGDWAVLGSIAN